MNIETLPPYTIPVTSPTMSSSTKPTPQQIHTASAAFAAFITDNKYAVVGGAALQLLVSTRLTEDVNFVVPRGAVSAARAVIERAKEHFNVDPRTCHTYYQSNPPVQIEILSLPTLFREVFNADTPIHAISIGGQLVNILKPPLILNSKCRYILGRPNEDKKSNDATDIKFLLCARQLANNVEIR